MSDDIREHARKRIKDRRQFWGSAATLTVVFVVLVLIWGVTSGWRGYFWPIWPAVGFVIAIAFHALNVFGPLGRPITEADVDREVKRLGGDGPAA